MRAQQAANLRFEPIAAKNNATDMVTQSYQNLFNSSWFLDNTAGSTLILRDDTIQVSSLDQLKPVLEELPEDWNMVRLDCDGGSVTRKKNGRAWYKQEENKSDTQSNAILFRKGALAMMRNRFIDSSFDSTLDCFLSQGTCEFQIYCVNLGISTSSKATISRSARRNNTTRNQ